MCSSDLLDYLTCVRALGDVCAVLQHPILPTECDSLAGELAHCLSEICVDQPELAECG